MPGEARYVWCAQPAGNSTRAYMPGVHTRAQGGGGLYGISKRKAERKAAKAAAGQRHAAQQAQHARHARCALQSHRRRLLHLSHAVGISILQMQPCHQWHA
jgi:hypothetical protein